MSVDWFLSLLLGYVFCGTGFYLLSKEYQVGAIVCFIIAMWHFLKSSYLNNKKP